MSRVLIAIIFLIQGMSYADAVSIDDVKSYVQSLKNISAQFVQLDRKGKAQTGKFYLSKPGKMRWEYQAPKELTIVLNNGKMYYYDKDLDQVSHYIGDYGMVNLLVENNIFDNKDIEIKNFVTDNSTTMLTLAKVGEENRLVLVFSSSPLKLLGCVLEDEMGNKTRLKFESLTDHFSLDSSLFTMKVSIAPKK